MVEEFGTVGARRPCVLICCHDQLAAHLMDGIRGRMNDLQVTVERPDGTFENLATGKIRAPNAADEAWAHFRRTGSTEKLEALEDLF